MLGLCGNDVFAAFLVKVSGTFDAHIVGFGSSTGKDDFLGRGPDQVGDLIAGDFRDAFSFPPIGMGTRMRISIRTNLNNNDNDK